MILQPYKITALRRNDSGGENILPNAAVAITANGGYASLYESDGTTPISNPFACDSNGEREVWIESGLYNISVSGGQSWDVIIGSAIDQKDTYADVRALTASYPFETIIVGGHSAVGDGGGGTFYLDAADVVSTDNGGTILVDAAGRRWKRVYSGAASWEWFRADPTFTSDSRASLQAMIDTLGPCDFGGRGNVFRVDGALIGNSGQSYYGSATIKAGASSDFEVVMDFQSKTGFYIGPLRFDANRQDRSGILTTRTIALQLTSCFDYILDGVEGNNTIGTASIPGVGIALGGVGGRGRLISPYCADNGITGKAADGIFCSHDNTIITSPIVINCLDTGVVLESCNNSGVIGLIADGCSAGAAITNATNDDKRGCYIHGGTIRNWSSAVTGGIQIGNPLNTSTGDLIDPAVSGITLFADTGAGSGVGPAINIRKTGVADTIGLSISDAIINGATAQGILGECIDIDIDGVRVSNAAASLIQLTGASTGFVSNCRGDGGTFGLITQNTSSVESISNRWSNQSSYGEYAFDTSNIESHGTKVKSPGVARYGKDGGAAQEVFTSISGDLAVSNAPSAVPAGAATGGVAVRDKAGSVLGYITLNNL